MARKPIALHSMHGVAKLLGLDRLEVRGTVNALGLKTYKGTRRELFIDDTGLARLRAHLDLAAVPG